MKKWLSLCLVGMFYYTIAYASAPLAPHDIHHLQPLNDLTEAISPYVKHIREAYGVLSDITKNWSKNNFEETINTINCLRVSLFQETNPNEPLPDENNLIITLININFNIRTMIEHHKCRILMRDLFSSTFERITQRCSLSSIMKKVKEEKAIIGSNIFNKFPDNNTATRIKFRNSVKYFLGRIFVVDNDKIIPIMSEGMDHLVKML